MKDTGQKKLKVLFFPAWYPYKWNKLGGKFINEHAKALNPFVDLGVFHVCSDPSSKYIIHYESFIEEEILIFRVSHKKYNSKILYPLNVLLYLFATIYGYCKVYKSFGKADINHVHVMTRSGLLPMFLKFLLKTPYVILEHWTRYTAESNSYHGSLRKYLTQKLVKNSEGLSAVSNDLLNALSKHQLFHKNFMKINNTVNTDEFFLQSNENKRFVFLHVSGLKDSTKNVSGILKAAAQLKSRNYHFELNIVGDDPDRFFLEKLAFDLELDNCTHFKGKLYGECLISEYKKADAFVLFSNFENQPCVLLESLCCGLPLISSNVGGIREIINKKNGVLIPARDEVRLATEMQNFIEGKYQFNKNLMREEALKKFSYNAVANQLLAFYRSALNRDVN